MAEKSAIPQIVGKSSSPQASPAANESSTLKLDQADTAFELINRLHESIARRAYELFEGEGGVDGRDIDHWFQAEAEVMRHIHINVSHSDGSTIVRAETPGFKAEDLQVTIEGRRVTIYGKRESSAEEKTGASKYAEFSTSETFRTVELPEDVDGANATATLKNGVLQLVLPKSAANTSAEPPPPPQAKAAASHIFVQPLVAAAIS